MIFVEILFYPIRLLVLGLIYLYKFLISPFLGKNCRYYPTCSRYMILAIKEWGLFRGLLLGMRRIFRCRPKCACGEDFVPLNIKGELKWTY